MQALIRLNNGKAVIPWFLEALTEALGEPIGLDALIPLPETDAASISYRNAYQDAVKKAAASVGSQNPTTSWNQQLAFGSRCLGEAPLRHVTRIGSCSDSSSPSSP